MGPNQPIFFEQHIEDRDGHPNLVTTIRMETAMGQGQSETFYFRLNQKPDAELIRKLDRNYRASVDELHDIANDIAVYVKLKTKKSDERLEREIFWEVLVDFAKNNHEALSDHDIQSLIIQNNEKNKADIMTAIDSAWQEIVEASKKTKKPLSDMVSDDSVQEAILETLPKLEKKAKELQGYAVDFGKGSYQFPNSDYRPINEEAIEAAVELRRQIENMRVALGDAWWHAAESVPDVLKVKLDNIRRGRNQPGESNEKKDNPEGYNLDGYHASIANKGINNPYLFRVHERASASQKKAKAALLDYGKKLGDNDSPENKETQSMVAKMLDDTSKAIDIISESRGLLQEIESSRAQGVRGK